MDVQNAAECDTGIIVLAGGAGRRMGGRNKALLRLPDPASSPTLIERVIAVALAALAVSDGPQTRRDSLVVVRGAGQAGVYDWLGGRVVEDSPRFGGVGPVAGLFAGLQATRHEWNLVLACDLPTLSVRLLQAMLAYPRDYAALVPRLADGRIEPLHAIYNRAACLPVIERDLAAGAYRMQAFIAQVAAVYMPEEEMRRYDPDLLSFFNLNAPTDIATLHPA